MTKRIGVHLRVTGHTSQGGRKYMEDCFSVAYQHTEDQSDLEYAYFGIFDGHGGSEAAIFAKNNLMDYIVTEKGFWSENDEDVLQAIREGFLKTHKKMWMIQDEWPKTASGLPSTAGTTASIAFVRHGKIYTGHVGDSGIILGYQDNENSPWLALPLTEDHKPESVTEKARIENNGGKVVTKSGVPRVVWNKPRVGEGHKGPVRRNTPVDEIPFLAVARSLGDLWSYNPDNDVFVVSPEPDVAVKTIDVNKFRCLLFGTDGLWNMLSPQQAVTLVQQAEANNKFIHINEKSKGEWINPSKRLVEEALLRWSNTRMRADNTTVVSLMLDPPGVPKKFITNRTVSALSQNYNYLEESLDRSPEISTLHDEATLEESISVSDKNIEEYEVNDNLQNSNEVYMQEIKEIGRYSTPYENVDYVDDMEDVVEDDSTVVYAELETMNVNKVTCIDDEDEINDSYDAFLMDFNAEHINNVIFGQLPKDFVCPKPIINSDINLNKVLTPLKINHNEECENYSQTSTMEEQSEVKSYTDLDSNKIENNAPVENIEDYEMKEKNMENEEKFETFFDSKNLCDDESESIQIHEISSSVSQDTIEILNQKTRLRKRSITAMNQNRDKKRKISTIVTRNVPKRNNTKQDSTINTKPTNFKDKINIHVRKIIGEKYWHPIVLLENCNLVTKPQSKNILKEKCNISTSKQKNKKNNINKNIAQIISHRTRRILKQNTLSSRKASRNKRK